MVEKVLKGPDISATRFQPLILSVSLICYKRHIVFTKSLLDKLKEIRNYSKPRCLKHTFLWFSHHNKRFLTLSSLFFDILILSVLECLDCLGNHPFSRFQEHPTQFITNLVSQRATSHLLFFFFRLFLWNSVECSIFVLGWTINLTFLLWYTVLCHLVIHIWISGYIYLNIWTLYIFGILPIFLDLHLTFSYTVPHHLPVCNCNLYFFSAAQKCPSGEIKILFYKLVKDLFFF